MAVVHKWLLFRGFSIKIAIKFDWAGLRVAIVGRWLLFRGGRLHRFNCSSCNLLTSSHNKVLTICFVGFLNRWKLDWNDGNASEK